MRWVCRLAVGTAVALILTSCGSTDEGVDGSDALVFDIVGFDGGGINQCDQFVGSNVDVDVEQDICNEMGEIEPFTDTFVNATVVNNQKLDIQLQSWTIDIGSANIGTYEFEGTQTANGKRCSNEVTRSCAVDRDCVILGGVGTCRSVDTSFQLRLFDIDTKLRIVPDILPIGRAFNVEVTLFGTDVSGGRWRATGSISAFFGNFNQCDCQLTQG